MANHSSSAAARFFAVPAVTAATIFVSTFAARAQDAGAFHEVETKYINLKQKPILARAAADATASAKPRLNMNLRQRNTCRSYLVPRSPITTFTVFQVSTTATWEQLMASRPNFARS